MKTWMKGAAVIGIITLSGYFHEHGAHPKVRFLETGREWAMIGDTKTGMDVTAGDVGVLHAKIGDTCWVFTGSIPVGLEGQSAKPVFVTLPCAKVAQL
jgi:hypothetical protein